MTAYREGFISAQDGKRLYYRDYGPRHGGDVPVLCLPGLARNSADFHHVALRLAERRRVICPDYRGRGRSDYDRDWRNYAPPRVVYDLLTLLTALGLGGVVAIGTSLGGLLAMGLAAARPAAIRGAVINDIGPEIDLAGTGRIRDYIGRDTALPDWPSAVTELRRMMPNLSPPGRGDEGWLTAARATWRQGEDGLLRYDFDVKLARTLAVRGPAPELWPLFRALGRVPLAIVRGELSDVLKPDTFARMVAARPDAVAVTIPGVGHVPHLDEPAAREAIDAVLDRA